MICSDKTTSICFTAETTELDTPQLPFGKYWHFSCFAQLTRCAHVYNKLKKSRSRDHFLTSSNFTSPLHWEFCTVIQRVVATAKSLSLSFFFSALRATLGRVKRIVQEHSQRQWGSVPVYHPSLSRLWKEQWWRWRASMMWVIYMESSAESFSMGMKGHRNNTQTAPAQRVAARKKKKGPPKLSHCF